MLRCQERALARLLACLFARLLTRSALSHWRALCRGPDHMAPLASWLSYSGTVGTSFPLPGFSFVYVTQRVAIVGTRVMDSYIEHHQACPLSFFRLLSVPCRRNKKSLFSTTPCLRFVTGWKHSASLSPWLFFFLFFIFRFFLERKSARSGYY